MGTCPYLSLLNMSHSAAHKLHILSVYLAASSDVYNASPPSLVLQFVPTRSIVGFA